MRTRFLVTVSTLVFTMAGNAMAAEANINSLDDISLESLGNIVTSVSKRPEDSFKSAAAITVITQEDIKLSGATHVAEVLRSVPGLEVAQIDAGNWAITSRGFNDPFANKLLVVVDGRTVYTPLFSGVYWDIQDVVLEDIERIEVIRGPGATQWGANAVNGVINIITKRAEKTQGVYVSQLLGTESRTITETRYGGAIGDNMFYRAYGKYAERDASEITNGDNGGNSWDSGKAGFRVDYDASSNRKLTFQGDIYDADIHLDVAPPTSTPPYVNFTRDKLSSRGGNFLTRWQENHGNGLESTFQAYYDFQSPDYSVLGQDIRTYDLDYQTSWAYDDRHTFVWGAGYRLIEDSFNGTSTLSLTPDDKSTQLFSAFVQDTIAIIPKSVDLTVGSKFEHNDYTGFEVQPSARLSWYPSETQTVWTAVSRAVRTPSRMEADGSLNVVYDPFNAVYIQQRGNTDMDTEDLIAYEAGYRWKLTPKFLVDASVYYNDYKNLRTFEFGAPEVTPAGDVIVPAMVNNLGEGQTYGFELASTWDVSERWSLTAGYTYITMDVNTESGSSDIVLEDEENKVPHNQFNIRSQLYITDDLDMTNTLYYVDQLPLYNIDSYLRFDTRFGYKVSPGIDLALVGQNLFSNEHQEFGAPLHGQANEIERNLYAKVTFRY